MHKSFLPTYLRYAPTHINTHYMADFVPFPTTRPPTTTQNPITMKASTTTVTLPPIMTWDQTTTEPQTTTQPLTTATDHDMDVPTTISK